MNALRSSIKEWDMANFAVKPIIWVLLVCLTLVVTLVLWMRVVNVQEMVNTDEFGVAIKGYDTVAYFTDKQAVKGASEFTYSWQDANWYFASATHRDMFAAEPERYAPRYGGFCAGGLVLGNNIFSVDPEAWIIVDGKLYLHNNKGGRDRWSQNKDENIRQGNQHWVEVQEQG